MDEAKCRICLQNSECRFRLDDRLVERFIWEAINAIADVCVQIGDPFPQSICLSCSQSLEQAIKFKNEVERSDQKLHGSDFEYVTFIKTETQEEAQMMTEEDLDEDTSVLEPTVIIKSKRGRSIKQRKFMYNEDDVEGIGRDVKFKKDPSIEIEADPVIVQHDTDTSDIPETKPKISPKPRKRKPKVIEYRCCMCQEKFADDNELTSHTEALHSEEIQANLTKKFITRQVYPCTYCHLRFRSRKFREKHFEIPNYKEPPRKRTYKPKPKVNQNIICTYCGKISADIYESRMHELRVHAEDYPIACTFPGCTKRFAAPIIQRKHMRIHAEKRFICDVCGKAFARPKHLQKHEYVHKDEKPLKCSICPKAFIHKNALKAHIEFHLTEKTYNCDQCDKTYKWKEDLQKHIRGVHLGDHPYKCKFCNKGYFCSSSRKYHQDRCQQSTGEQLLDLKVAIV